MKIKVFDSASEASKFTAKKISDLIKNSPESRLGLATGRTMDAVYNHLSNQHKIAPFDCSKVRAFALDEYVGLEPRDENSYRYYLDFHIFQSLGFDNNNTFLPDVHMADLNQAALEYEKLIIKTGGIDLQILGIGMNGHIGLNEPGSKVDSRTRVVDLSESTLDSNRPLFKDAEIPKKAMTMGVGTILEAKEIVLLATGKTKAEIIKNLVNANVGADLPASFLKTHSNALLVLDKDSASLLS